MNFSSSFPSFWRNPITPSTSPAQRFQHNNIMPGSTDQEIHMTGGGEQPKANLGNGLIEHRTHQYVNRPDGEMDMMIGFFLMNGFCVSFFLLFGLCVIFSCLRKRPSYFRRKQFFEADSTQTTQDESLKPKLKSIVSQVIKSNKVTTKVSMNHLNSDLESMPQEIQAMKTYSAQPSRSPTPSHCGRKPSLNTSRQPSFENSRRCSTSISQENSAMIRHNLLGPLSFDDLHYM